MKKIEIENSGLHFVITVRNDGKTCLEHFGVNPWDGEVRDCPYSNLLELHCLGSNVDDHHGSRHTKTHPAAMMRYVSHNLSDVQDGRMLEVLLTGDGLETLLRYRFYTGIPAAQCTVTVKNISDKELVLDYITSFCYYGVTDGYDEKWEQSAMFYIPHNTWHGEVQWRKNTAEELGISRLEVSSLSRIYVSQSGTWSTGEYLPMGAVENAATGDILFWQIEHNGSWYAESASVPNRGLYLHLGGPNGDCHQFEKRLRPGESFESVPVTVGASAGSFDAAIGALTNWRRRTRREFEDNKKLSVIYNDYMNCLMGDPTEERSLPLIDAAADAGCEYYVIDAGWFADTFDDGAWWDTVGCFKEAECRFPNTLNFLMERIREKGMIPGIWVEVEDISAECEAAKNMPDDWFFSRKGQKILEHGRYQLDFRNPAVFDYAIGVCEGLIEKYGLGYLKIDYNINAGLGTDLNSDSLGEGLLEHNRAVLRWFDTLLSRNPDLVIENCASGGMRMDYAMLSRIPIQSTSDQTNHRMYSAISAMAATAVTPEQKAVWSYPTPEDSCEKTAFNMINSMLGRVHQSGFLNRLTEENLALVKEGISYYKSIRQDISTGIPFFPLGIVTFNSPWMAFGLLCGNKAYLSLWRREGDEDTVHMPLSFIKDRSIKVSCPYPLDFPVSFESDTALGTLSVTLPQRNTARLIEIELKQ